MDPLKLYNPSMLDKDEEFIVPFPRVLVIEVGIELICHAKSGQVSKEPQKSIIMRYKDSHPRPTNGTSQRKIQKKYPQKVGKMLGANNCQVWKFDLERAQRLTKPRPLESHKRES